jgi:hypothetical protein
MRTTHHRRWPTLDGLSDVFTDALEGVGPLLLNLRREHLDLDARELLRQRFAARRLGARVCRDRRLRRRRGRLGRGRGPPATVEQHVQQRHRELCVAGREPLSLRAEDPQLQLAA